MCAPSVRPFAGGVPLPRRAAPAPSDDASERASGKKRPRARAPARDSSACRLTKMTRNRNRNSTGMMEVLTVGGETSVSGDPARAQERLKKRLASELDALRGLVKKAELISRGGGACNGGAPTAGKKERFLAPKPIEDTNAPWVKRRKISTLVEEKHIETGSKASSSSSGDSHTDSDSSGSESDDECRVDRPAQAPPEQKQTLATSEPAQQSTEANKVQVVQRAAPKAAAVYMPGLLYRANLRRQLLEMERAALPDQSIHPRELQRLGISEYGDPSVMWQLGLVLKVDA